MNFLRKNLLTTFGLAILALVAIPATFFLYQQQSDSRSRAQTAPTVCQENAPVDVTLIIDRSGSMLDKTGSGAILTGPSKNSLAKTAANKFVDILSQNTQSRVGLVTFSTAASLDSTLTNNYSFIKTKINAIPADGWTCIECGIKRANADIQAAGRTNIKKAIVLLTDGQANYIDGNSQQQSITLSEQRALAAATAGRTTNGTVFFTIGLGNDVNSTFLQQIATSTGGQYYFTPTGDQLTAIYTQISQIVAQGSVTGTVFKDANRNAAMDTSEQKLSGWTIQITNTANSQQRTVTTDVNGNYTITGLCDGAYTVKPVMQSGWQQTFPTNSQSQSITINNATALTDKNFGVAQAARCSDDVDNDNNDFTDEEDSTCHTDGDPENSSTYDPNLNGENGGGNTCADSKDNNGNGLIDGADPRCHTDGDPDNPDSYDPNRPENSARCSDNIDNDNNDFTDEEDSSCHTDGNPNNSSTYDPDRDGEHGGNNTCGDSKDNNGNGLIDGADPICHTDGNVNNPNSYDPDRPETTNQTVISLNLTLHGIGAGGDNASPNLNSLSNKNPLHETLSSVVTIFNDDNEQVASATTTITYNQANGNYTGSATITPGLPTGAYTVKVRIPQHLTRVFPGIQTLLLGGTNQLPVVGIVAGDTNNDNKLNILDYNMLLDCYSDLLPAVVCN